jgi:two-component system, NtrC family, C4-dicarboxylate transport response regulator DctD
MVTNDKGEKGAFHILVVDDEVSVLEVMAEMLEAAGWRVDAVSNAAEALRCTKRTRYDALVLDLYMPDLPGLLLHSKLKFIDRELWKRTVFVSGHFSTEDLRRSLEGSPRFVQKPFKSEALLGIVGLALPEVPRSISESAASSRPDGRPVRS